VPKAPRHPEVDQENATAFEPNNQILAATFYRGDTLAFELGGDDVRFERPDEPRVVDDDVLEDAADEDRLEAGPDSLDLR
jgi:hypothetical protein